MKFFAITQSESQIQEKYHCTTEFASHFLHLSDGKEFHARTGKLPINNPDKQYNSPKKKDKRTNNTTAQRQRTKGQTIQQPKEKGQKDKQ